MNLRRRLGLALIMLLAGSIVLSGAPMVAPHGVARASTVATTGPHGRAKPHGKATVRVLVVTSGTERQVLVTCSGFAPRERVRIFIGGVSRAVLVTRVSAAGVLAPTLVTIPSAVAVGVRTVTVVGVQTHVSASAQVTFKATVATLAASTGIATIGQVVTVTCHGFAPGEQVVFTLSGISVPVVVARATAAGTVVARVTIATTLAAGVHTLTATGLVSHRAASAALAIVTAAAPSIATLTAGAAAVAAGKVLALSGQGFAANEMVALSIGGVAVATVQASATGALSAQVTIPATIAVGVHTIAAMGLVSHRAATVTVTVGAAPSATQAVCVPSTGMTVAITPGATMMLALSGFAPGEAVTIRLSGVAAALATVQASAAGSVVTSVTIPSGVAPGLHTLTATGAVSTHTATLFVTVVPAGQAVSSQTSTTPTSPATSTVTTATATLAASVTTATTGQLVTVTGQGFAPGETVVLTFSGIPVSVAVVQTTATGIAVAHVRISATMAAGVHTLMATGLVSHRVATVTLTIKATVKSTAALTASAGTVAAGSAVTLIGQGFVPNEAVALTISGVATDSPSSVPRRRAPWPSTSPSSPAPLVCAR